MIIERGQVPQNQYAPVRFKTPTTAKEKKTYARITITTEADRPVRDLNTLKVNANIDQQAREPSSVDKI